MGFLAEIVRYVFGRKRTDVEKALQAERVVVQDCTDALASGLLRNENAKFFTRDRLRKAEERVRDLERRQAQEARETELRLTARTTAPAKSRHPDDPYADHEYRKHIPIEPPISLGTAAPSWRETPALTPVRR